VSFALPYRLIVLVLGAFALVLLCLMLTGVAPTEAVREFVVGAVGSAAGWRDTLKETTPLLLIGVAVFLALRAGLFNIGAEGQFVVGACAAAVIALRVPGILGIILAIIVGALAGALWALPAGLIKSYRGGHEVITTIMLNNIAFFITSGLVAGPLKDPDQQSPTTDLIEASTRLPAVLSSPPFRLNLGLVIAVAAVLVFIVWYRRTVAGYEVAATGANPTAAETAGVPIKRITVRAMSVSGAIAGLAGAVQVLAYENRFYAGFSPGYGFDGLGVAILAGASPWGLFPSALLFGIISKGTSALQLLGVPKGLSSVLLGLLIIAFAAYRFRRTPRVD